MIKNALFALPLLLLPLAGCEHASHAGTPAGASNAAASTAAVGDDATIPRIASGTKMVCPVSHEDFTVGAKTVQVTYKGKRYAFCCADCRPDFEKNPAKYAK